MAHFLVSIIKGVTNINILKHLGGDIYSMSLESDLEHIMEKAIEKGGRKALVKGVEELLEKGLIEDMTQRVISVAIVEIMKVIQIGVALAIGKAVIGSSIVQNEAQIEELKKGILNAVATKYDNIKIEELLKEVLSNNGDNIKKI